MSRDYEALKPTRPSQKHWTAEYIRQDKIEVVELNHPTSPEEKVKVYSATTKLDNFTESTTVTMKPGMH